MKNNENSEDLLLKGRQNDINEITHIEEGNC